MMAFSSTRHSDEQLQLGPVEFHPSLVTALAVFKLDKLSSLLFSSLGCTGFCSSYFLAPGLTLTRFISLKIMESKSWRSCHRLVLSVPKRREESFTERYPTKGLRVCFLHLINSFASKVSSFSDIKRPLHYFIRSLCSSGR
jgi:hypothetical protein